MARVRITQLVTTLDPGGAERCVFDLATRLDRDRFDVRVIGLRGGAMAAKLHKAGIGVDVLEVTGKWQLAHNRRQVKRLAALLDEHQTDLLHSHLFHADMFARLAMKRCGVERHVHTVHVAERRWRPWRFMWARWMRRRCDRIVAVSTSVRDHHSRQSHLPLSDYTVIPNGIDVGRFTPDADIRRQFRMKWDIGPGEALAIFVGRLDKQKGVDVLLDAARLLQGRGSDVTLLIAGAGPMQAQVEAACGECETLYHLGFIEDIVPFLQAADMFVLPSRWEGWPLALGEAMAAGLPAIGAAAPGITDVITDGQTGVLVDVGDAAALAEAIERLAADAGERQRLAGAGREMIAGEFTTDQFIAAHESLYDRITATL
jgi:glycosyltransferase involved in cell wall biosynthesis